jgi:hypothetical protein
MISELISATMTKAMWRQEHLWNVHVVQRVHLSDFVYLNRVILKENRTYGGIYLQEVLRNKRRKDRKNAGND